MRLALLLTCGVALVLGALLTLEVLQPAPDDDAVADATGIMPASRARLPASKTAAAAIQPQTVHGEEWVATILARPLFTRDRRPPTAAATAAAASDAGGALPRLTGIAISPDLRRAIFAGPDGGKPVVVTEGDTIAGFTVQTIAPDGIKVQGPGGDRIIVPAFDPSPPAVATADQPIQPPGQPPYGQPPFGQPPYGQPLIPPPYPGFGGVGPTRPVGPLDPTGQPMARAPLPRPRAERDALPLTSAHRSS